VRPLTLSLFAFRFGRNNGFALGYGFPFSFAGETVFFGRYTLLLNAGSVFSPPNFSFRNLNIG
jgi:hypothetical protein